MSKPVLVHGKRFELSRIPGLPKSFCSDPKVAVFISRRYQRELRDLKKALRQEFDQKVDEAFDD